MRSNTKFKSLKINTEIKACMLPTNFNNFCNNHFKLKQTILFDSFNKNYYTVVNTVQFINNIKTS